MYEYRIILLTATIAMIILVVSSAWRLHKKLDAEGQDRVVAYWLMNSNLLSKVCHVYMVLRGWKLRP